MFKTRLQLVEAGEGPDGRSNFELTAALIFETAFENSRNVGVRVRVPAGFTTDFASVPRFLWWWFPPSGRHSKSAVTHDYLYCQASGCSRWLADALFREAMAQDGVGWWKRTAMYYAVRLFGGGAYHSR